MKVYLGADHRGFSAKEALKTWLQGQGYEVVDAGNTQLDPNDDYTTFAFAVGEHLVQEPEAKGILFCGSGVGMNMAAGIFSGVKPGLGLSPEQVQAATKHDNMNVLVIATDYTSTDAQRAMTAEFLKTSFDAEPRHQRRLDVIEEKRKGL